MSTDELVKRIQMRASNPKRRTSTSHFALERFKHDPRWSRDYPPVSLEQVNQAETKLGFKLPSLLGRLYVEIGNGGFGPGYGMFGLEGGFAAEDTGWTLPDWYLAYADPKPGALAMPGWPKKLVPICDWGDCIFSCIDCSLSPEQMVIALDPVTRTPENGLTFEQWMEDWVKGVDLFKRAIGTGRRPKRVGK
jgi:hypothetical protein